MMKSSVATLLLLVFWIIRGASAADKMVAMVERVCDSGQQDAQVARIDGSKEEASQYLSLNVGDRIFIKSDSKAGVVVRYALPSEPSVLIQRALTEEIPCRFDPESGCLAARLESGTPKIFCIPLDGSAYEIQPPAADDVRSKKLAGLFVEMLSAFIRLEKVNMHVIPQPYMNDESVDPDSPIRLLSPFRSRVFSTRPVFRWTGRPEMEFSLRLFELHSEAPIFAHSGLKETVFRYPSEEPSLKPGTVYLWEIAADGEKPQRVFFETISEKEEREIIAWLTIIGGPDRENHSDWSTVLLQARLFIGEKFFADAMELLLELQNRVPDDPMIHAQLKEIYEQQRMFDLARMEQARAQKEDRKE